MPIYEFYCRDCHMLFNFFSAGVNTTKRPPCPRCDNRELERRLSSFATVKSIGDKGDSSQGSSEAGPDDARMERAMAALADEAGSLNEDDPRQAAQMMRRLSEMAGMNIGPGMEEALKRIESGEDPEAVESELGDVLESEDPFGADGDRAGGEKTAPGASAARRARPPARDDKLYTL